MFQIAICEDSKVDTDLLSQTLAAAANDLRIRARTDYYKNGEELILALKDGASYDLLLLDIFLEQVNGVDTARSARKYLPHVQIAFLTSSRDYALDAYDLDAIHYLMKPVDREKLGVDIYLSDIAEPQRIPISFIRVEEQLASSSFLRISRSLMVRIGYIRCIDKNVCYFRDGTSALISRREKSIVRKKYNDYLFNHSQEGEYP
ncbi:MAG TPA: response regulator [Candidatus Ruminococcus avistercoris]|nr:response regulator [Candidatus Ruminococcus avistercoris]